MNFTEINFEAQAQKLLHSALPENYLTVFKEKIGLLKYNEYCLFRFTCLEMFRVIVTGISVQQSPFSSPELIFKANKFLINLLPEHFPNLMQEAFKVLDLELDDFKSPILFEHCIIEALDHMFSSFEILNFVTNEKRK